MPVIKLGRLRKNKVIRDLVSQTKLSVGDFILPYFVVEGRNIKKPIGSMPGVYHLSADILIRDLAANPQIKTILLFGVPAEKDNLASQSYKKDAALQRAVRAVKKKFKKLTVMTDVCLCGYTSHGHCGIIRPQVTSHKSQAMSLMHNFIIDNKETLRVLARIAVSHAGAGADFVAPSAMVDGQVAAIRGALDQRGHNEAGIMAYSAKYASNFYGPFRDALDSKPKFGDRKGYQMDFRNSDEALREIGQDLKEGADLVMVKPALAYLDIICRVRQKFNAPLVAYNVSGEYSMVKAIAKGDKSLERDLALEIITSIKRAGADLIITYWAKDLVKWLR